MSMLYAYTIIYNILYVLAESGYLRVPNVLHVTTAHAAVAYNA